MGVFERYRKHMTPGVLALRLVSAYPLLMVGLSLIIQTQLVLPTRDFVDSLDVPSGVFGTIFVACAVAQWGATYVMRSDWLYTAYQASAIFCFLWCTAYLPPLVTDFQHVSLSGFGLYSFLAVLYQVLAYFEVLRIRNIGMFEHEPKGVVR